MIIEERVLGWETRFINASAWSTCELRLSGEAFETLVRDLTLIPAERFKNPPKWLGLALTVALAECGRRDANENDFWVPVSRRFKEAAWHRRIFTQIGQPTAFCRRLLEDTARHYKLHNVYGHEDTMEWFVSMRLQFGFTRQGFEKRLHEWLAGAGMPVPLRLLLGYETAALKADSFLKLWKHLWLYRKDRISELQLQTCLEESPWVLPEWYDALITKALERREYDYVYQQRGGEDDANYWMPCVPEEASDEGFLTHPRLIWERGIAPRFELTFDIGAITWDSCGQPEYTLWVGGERRGRVLRQSDGTYRAELDKIVLQHPLPSIDAEVRDELGIVISEQRIDLWDGEVEAVVFDLTAGGVALPVENRPALKAENEYAVLTAPDLTVKPESEECRTFAGRRIFRLTAHACTPAVIYFDDGTEFDTLAVTERETANLDGVRAELIAGDGAFPEDLALGVRYRVRVTVPHTSILRRVRRDGVTLPSGAVTSAVWVSAPLDLSETEHARGVRLQIVVAIGDETHSFSRTAYAQVNGAALWEAGTDYTFTRSAARDRPLYTHKARTTQFLFRVNGEAHGHFIFEGGFCHGRIKTKPSALKKLHGFGAPLTIGYSRFHTSGEKNVSPAVLDTGILGEVDVSGIELLHPLYTNDGHRLVVVRPDWSVVSDHVRMDSGRNRLDADLLSGGWLTVGLFYKGHRQGARWNMTEFHRSITVAPDPPRVARVITLFKLPFLHPAFKKSARIYLLEHPVAFLETWTVQGGQNIELDGMSFADPGLTGDDNLRYAVCSLIGTDRVNMADEMCRDVIGSFGGDADNPTAEALALLLDDVLDWSPRLAARIARSAATVDAAELCHCILKGTRQECINVVARDTGTSREFIGRLLTSVGTGNVGWADDLSRLLPHRTFRRLLTCFFISNPRV